jgi:hypothetical protein
MEHCERHDCRRWALGLAAYALLGLAPAIAQTTDPDDVSADRFISHNWSQIFPDYGFRRGCVNGYQAFAFLDNGAFVFNHRVRGSWRIDGQGNMSLRTQQGTQFRLLFDGSALTSPVATAYFRRSARFAECQ